MSEREADSGGGGKGEVTELLARWNEGEVEVAGEVAAELFDELRKIASSYLRRERPDHTLQPTALVNELYLRLLDRRQVSWRDRSHFFAFAARTLRRILVDHARRHDAEKRSGNREQITLDSRLVLSLPREVEMLELDRALELLEAEDARLARVVELRFFGGLTIEEVAEALDIGTATVKRDLRAARAFLLHRLKHLRKDRDEAESAEDASDED